MARKTVAETISTPGRDLGKTFVLTEMDAWAAIQWATRALLSLTNAGVQIPAGAFSGAPENIAAMGLTLLAMVPASVALPLLDEGRQCIQVRPPNGGLALQPIDFGGVSAIEEPSTWVYLLRRLFELHVGFSLADATPSTDSEPAVAAA